MGRRLDIQLLHEGLRRLGAWNSVRVNTYVLLNQSP